MARHDSGGLSPHGRWLVAFFGARSMARQAGFSLLELLLAAALGVLICWAMLDINVGALRVMKNIQRNQQVYESGRLLLDILRSEVRLAGFFGRVGARKPALSDRPSLCFRFSHGDVNKVFNAPIDGLDNAPAGSRGCGGKQLLPGSDVLLIRHADTRVATAIEARRDYVQATPKALALIRYNDIWADELTVCCQGFRAYHQQLFFVTEDHVFRRKRWRRGSFSASEPLAEGVDNFQVLYALASDEAPLTGAAARLQYVALPRGDLQWSRVRSVQLSLWLSAPIDGSVSASSRAPLDHQALNAQGPRQRVMRLQVNVPNVAIQAVQ